MAELEKLGNIAQTEILVIPIIDVSGSMAGEKIGQVNSAMETVPSQLVQINNDSLEVKLLIAPMEFSSGARWVSLKHNQPIEPESYRWVDVKAAGITDLGRALELLTQKLTVTEKGGWMKGRGGAAPVLILISDGAPTDDYRTQLEELKRRGWFGAAIKFALAVGDDADMGVLSEFTGSTESVIKITDFSDLGAIVKTVIVSASKSVSKSASVSAMSKQSTKVEDSGPDINQEAQAEVTAAVVKAVEDITLDNGSDLF